MIGNALRMFDYLLDRPARIVVVVVLDITETPYFKHVGREGQRALGAIGALSAMIDESELMFDFLLARLQGGD